MPFFSVVIPLYNKEKFIGNTLQSVLGQTFSDFEVVVVDDGSTDSSAATVKQFTDSRIQYYSKENEGVSTARNFGINAAASDFIAFIDADDFWYPDFLQTMHQNIQRFPDQMVFSAAIEVETARNLIPAQYSIQKTGVCELVDFFEASCKEAVIWTSAAVFHKDVFQKCGVFDMAIKSGQDTDLWMRIGLVYKVVFCWKVLARYVYDDNSLSKNMAYTATKINFSKFSELEKSNSKLKKYLDLNRFSLAIKSKIHNDPTGFNNFYHAIDLNGISWKKKILLKLPPFLLKRLIRVKRQLAEVGLGNSVFK